MRNFIIFLASLLLGSPSIGAADQNNAQAYTMKNARWVEDGHILVGGQISHADIQQMHQDGITSIINMRLPHEFNDKPLAIFSERQAINFVRLPVSHKDNINLQTAHELDQYIERFQGQKIVLYCASSNRVGALLAIRAYFIQGKTQEEAIKLGRMAGMKSLTKTVKNLLNNNQKEKDNSL